MKKALKIIGLSLLSLLGLVVVTAIGIAIFAPGLPAYLYVKKTCVNVNQTAEPYVLSETAAAPSDWQTVTANGVSIRTEASFEEKSNSAMVVYRRTPEGAEKSDALVAITEPNDETIDLVGEQEKLTKDASGGSMLVGKQKKLTKEDMEQYFSHMDEKLPTNYYELATILYRLNLDRFPMHSFRDSIMFATLAMMKEILVPAGRQFLYETDEMRVLITEMRNNQDGEKGYAYAFSMYDNDASEIEHMILLSAPDKALIDQMFATVQLVPETEPS